MPPRLFATGNYRLGQGFGLERLSSGPLESDTASLFCATIGL